MNKYPTSALLFSMVLLVVPPASHAGEIDGIVEPLASPVSLSVNGSKPVATYVVTLTNTSANNTINNARLVATTTVEGGAIDAKAIYKSVSGGTATCSANSDGTRVDCSVGALTVGQSRQFTLNFFSPTSGASVVLSWDAVFDFGTPPGGSNGDSGYASISLQQIDPTKVTSAVPPNEIVEVFTGNLALPSNTDQFTVAITVPPVNVATTASVTEKDVSANTNCRSLRNFSACFESKISIPTVDLTGNDSYLTFFLQIDESNIRKGTKIDKVLVQYDADDDDTNGLTLAIVQYCSRNGAGMPMPNGDGTPCIAQANDYTRRPSPEGWYGFQWKFISFKNGRFSLY